MFPAPAFGVSEHPPPPPPPVEAVSLPEVELVAGSPRTTVTGCSSAFVAVKEIVAVIVPFVVSRDTLVTVPLSGMTVAF